MHDVAFLIDPAGEGGADRPDGFLEIPSGLVMDGSALMDLDGGGVPFADVAADVVRCQICRAG